MHNLNVFHFVQLILDVLIFAVRKTNKCSVGEITLYISWKSLGPEEERLTTLEEEEVVTSKATASWHPWDQWQ